MALDRADFNHTVGAKSRIIRASGALALPLGQAETP